MTGRACRLPECPARGRRDLDGFCSKAHLQAMLSAPVTVRQGPIVQSEAELDPPTEPVLSPVALDAAARAPERPRRARWVIGLVLLAVVAALWLYGRPGPAQPVGTVVAPAAPTSSVQAPVEPPPTSEPEPTTRARSGKASMRPSTSARATKPSARRSATASRDPLVAELRRTVAELAEEQARTAPPRR